MLRHPATHRPLTRPVREALDANATLGNLLARVRESRARLAVVHRALPASLRAHVRDGVLDADGWHLLAGNAAVAAKLRLLVPDLQLALTSQGFAEVPIQVRVRPAQG